jgi:ATP-dependent exoDNAse (exonuclease V) beta subunit
VPDDNQLRRAAQQLLDATSTVDVEHELSRFRQLLERPEIQRVLLRGQYCPPAGLDGVAGLLDRLSTGQGRLQVQNERRFAIREDDTLLTGSIDRLVLISHKDDLIAADVTDYKTDVIAAEDEAGLQSRIEYYRPQLAAYRRAVSRFTKLEESQIATRVVFLHSCSVIDL